MDGKSNKNIFFKIFAGVLILLILFFSKKENQERFIEFINLDSLVLDEVFIVNSISTDGNIDNIAYYDDSILTWQNNRLTRYKTEGSKEWEKEFNFSYPYVTFGNTGIYVCDRDLGDIYYLNSEGDTIGRFKIKGRIKSIKEYSEHIAVHVEEDNKEGINILEANGNLISSKFIEESNILNYCFNNKANRYAYSTLKLENERIISEIQVYTLEGELNWTFQIEDEIIMYLNTVDERGLVAMSDRRLYYIDKGNILWQKDISLAKDIHVNGESIYILYDKTYEIISIDGTTKEILTFPKEYKKLTFIDGYTILYGEESIMGLKNMKKIFIYEPEKPIIKVIEGSRNIIVTYEDRIDIVSF